MFVETITTSREEWERWTERLRLRSDPPAALIASIAWASGDDEVTEVHPWETPDAISDLYIERVLPIVQAEGEPANKPKRHGEPISVYLRP